MMAEAVGKLPGKPVACFVTRAPGGPMPRLGSTSPTTRPNACVRRPVERRVRERDALQELDYRAVFGPMAK